MSFSSTPLGQGRRLDHHTFLNKPNARDNRPPHSPPRRAIPTSYAYGAPSLSTRSPPKPDRANPLEGEPDPSDDSDETALVRFARLKQREQAQQSRTGASAGPSQSYAPPHPEKWSVKDTSVNIAGAFNQAVTSADDVMPPNNPNEAWASGARKPMLPRSTSVEYEKETQSTVNRRLAPPPSRNGARFVKQVSKMAPIRRVPDSEGEDDEPADQSERARTPFEQVLDVTRRMNPVTFLMRARSREPDTSNSQVNGSHVGNDSSSYDYSAEEREYQATMAAQKPPSRRTVAPAHKRNRMSMDNKAYKPTVSDLEESDEELDDDGRRTRRKKKKNGVHGGPPLTTLPVAAYDKRKKRRRSNGKTNGVEGEEEGASSEEQEQEQEREQESRVSEQRSQRGNTPVIRPPSSRGSQPSHSRPPSRASVSRESMPLPGDSSSYNATLDVEHALDPIREIDEDLLIDGVDPLPQQSTFSIGASLGRGVNGLFRLGWAILQFLFACVAFITRLCGKTLGVTLDILINRPVRWISHADPLPFARYAVIGLTIYSAWYALNRGWLSNLGSWSFPSAHKLYQAPDIPITNSGELADRLHRLELALAQLSVDTERSRTILEGSRSELVGRVGALESQVHKDSIRAVDAETKFRATTSDALQAVKQEVNQLHSQIKTYQANEARNRPISSADEDARAKVRALEDQLGHMQSDVLEALELGKNAVKVAGTVGSTAAWWNKLASGSAGTSLTIKSSDGHDVTALLESLIDRRVFKDALARPDFADHSAGARIIPALTADTYAIPSPSWAQQMISYISGHSSGLVGRPPVTALHHDTHNGLCWPFPGTQGRLGVALSAPTYISDITIDHVPREVSMDMRSAPRQMELWGLVEGKENIEKVKEWRARRAALREEARVQAELTGQPYVEEPEPEYPASLPSSPEYIRVANFTYNIYAPHHIQSFPVSQDIRDIGIDFGIVVLLIHNNWGQDDYTCLYRLRVYGEHIGELPAPYPEEYAQA